MSVPQITLSSGHKMPILGLGMFLTKDESEVLKTLEAALDVGYRHIDTAFSYQNEAFIGSALQKLFRENKIKREDLFVTTKLPPNGLRPENLPYFFHKSLSELQIGYVDLYLLHFPAAVKRTENDYAAFPMKDGVLDADTVDLVDSWQALEKFVEQGLVRSIGLSNFNSQQIQRVYDAATIKPSVLQIECHAYLPQYEMQEFCKKLNIAMTAYSPIGAPGSVTEFENNSPEGRLLDDERLKAICQKYGKSPAQVLLRFLVQRDIIAIPKSSNPKRLAENMQIFDFSLSNEDMLTMKSMARNKRYFSFESYKGMTDHPEYPFKIPF